LDGTVEARDIGINVKPQETNYMTSKVQQLVESHEEVRIAKDLINWKVQYASIVTNQKI
jgi:citrate lyase gamma subunit